mgnify:CR=1 FL=1
MTAIDPDTLIDDTTFADLGLAQPLLAALSDAGYERPTPIQRDAIPLALKGRDLIGLAGRVVGLAALFLVFSCATLLKRPVTVEPSGFMELSTLLIPQNTSGVKLRALPSYFV